MGNEELDMPCLDYVKVENSEHKYYENKDIIKIVEWKYKSTTIQIMHINPNLHTDLTKFIDQYDLDFCKVIFDGTSLNVMYPKSVTIRTSKYNRITDWNGRRQYRTDKYTKRGFKVEE